MLLFVLSSEDESAASAQRLLLLSHLFGEGDDASMAAVPRRRVVCGEFRGQVMVHRARMGTQVGGGRRKRAEVTAGDVVAEPSS